ncbi:MAG: MarR family winged helix-turn-helix transcriptional regulator [Phycisphaerae bacterium]
MTPDISRLETHLGYWLRFVSNHVSHNFRRKVEAHGVTVAEWVVMRSLFDTDAVNPSRLSQTIGLTRGAISKLMDRLIAKGFVLRRDEKNDRRCHTVALSAAGRRLVPILAHLADLNDREFFGHLNNHDRAALASILKNIVQARNLKHVPIE